MIVCHQGARLIGYAVYRRWPAPLRMITLLRLAVMPELRCRGYGQKLVQWLYNFARQLASECNRVGLSALPGAVEFYKRVGFACVNRRNGDADPGTDDGDSLESAEVWMELRIPPKGATRARSRSQPKSR